MEYTDTNGDSSVNAGDTLTARWSFADLDLDLVDGPRTEATIQWRRNGNAIAGKTGPTYVIAPEDAGSPISFEFIPWTDPAITEPASGQLHDSITHNNGSGPGSIDPTDGVTLTAVTITGTTAGRPIVGQVLTANVTCTGGGGCGTVSYTWQRQRDAGGWTTVGTNSATYTPAREDQLHNIQVLATRTGP
jgi:hypothetical protein